MAPLKVFVFDEDVYAHIQTILTDMTAQLEVGVGDDFMEITSKFHPYLPVC